MNELDKNDSLKKQFGINLNMNYLNNMQTRFNNFANQEEPDLIYLYNLFWCRSLLLKRLGLL